MDKFYKHPRTKFVLTGVSLLMATALNAVQAKDANFIVNCKADCGTLIEKVTSLGGKVTNKYKNINAISITMDSDNRAQLQTVNPAAIIIKDKIFSLPAPKDEISLKGKADFTVLKGDKLDKFIKQAPKGFDFNNILTGAATMNAAGFSGQGAVVAVIDTGTANNADVVPSLAGSVIGGENFVPGEGEPSATSTANGPHGTNTGSMIAAHTFFLLDSSSSFAQSVANNQPASIYTDFFPGVSVLPLFGSAPEAKLYALKVFAAAGGGSPESRIIAAMDRAITLRTNYNDGMPVEPVNPGCGAEDDPCIYDSLNIKVVNMSLGGGTLYAAKDLEDQLTNKMLDAGITLVASAGNEGFAAITGGSPGTGEGALTVGAASTVGNERILRDLQFGLGIGAFYRPGNHHQMATFSSRGPSADGRISTDVVANGFACLVQNANGSLNLASGTSFSAPMVAGAAATLVSAFPEASAVEIRNALVQSANPDILGDNSGAIDQGAGFIDIPAAYGLLASGSVNTSLPKGKGNKILANNIKSLGLKVLSADFRHVKTKHVANLKAGQVAHFFIESKPETDRITINIDNVKASLPADEQNLFFGDDVYFVLQDAITHTDAIISSGFVVNGTEIVVDNPQTGILRLAVMGDWTNAGDISADISILGHKSKQPHNVRKGRVDQSETQTDTIYIPDGTTQVTFELKWRNNWGAYPTDDIDLILLDPNFDAYFDGATFSSPERVVINNPTPGEWTMFVQGFTVQNVNEGPGSKWQMSITDQDGNSIK